MQNSAETEICYIQVTHFGNKKMHSTTVPKYSRMIDTNPDHPVLLAGHNLEVTIIVTKVHFNTEGYIFFSTTIHHKKI